MDILELLKDDSKTIKEIAQILNKSTATISRMRVKYGISIKRGSKRGKPKPWQIKDLEDRNCLYCNSTFSVKPGSPRRYCNKSCGAKNMDRSYMQTENYKNTLRNPDLPEFTKYSRKVHKLTKKLYEQHYDIINPNGYKRGIAGEEGAYHLDHIIPIKYGYENKIPPEDIARIENLQMLPWKTNVVKSSNYEENE